MEVVDVVLFNNELDLLDLRVKILENVVDIFVVKEATQTFQGSKKEMLARTYSHPKVRVVEFDFPQDIVEPGEEVNLYQQNNNWARDKFQRGFTVDLESLGVSSDAIILTSDLDEVPDPKAIAWLKDNFDPELVYAFELINHQYYLNVRNLSEPIFGTRACSVETYNTMNAQEIRELFTLQGLSIVLPQSGWHWTFLGGAEQIRYKIDSYAHTEHKNSQVLDSIQYRMDNNLDVLGRDFELVTVPVDNSYPDYILNNQEQLSHFIKEL